jgi:hypothetical protein
MFGSLWIGRVITGRRMKVALVLLYFARVLPLILGLLGH